MNDDKFLYFIDSVIEIGNWLKDNPDYIEPYLALKNVKRNDLALVKQLIDRLSCD